MLFLIPSVSMSTIGEYCCTGGGCGGGGGGSGSGSKKVSNCDGMII